MTRMVHLEQVLKCGQWIGYNISLASTLHLMSFGNTWRKTGYIKLTCGWLDFKIYHILGKTPMLQLKVTMGHWRPNWNQGKVDWLVTCGLVHPWVNRKCPHSILVSKSMQELWVREQQMPTIVCGWGLVGGTIDSWHKCDIVFLWWWSNTYHVIKKSPSTIHHPQPNVRMDML